MKRKLLNIFALFMGVLFLSTPASASLLDPDTVWEEVTLSDYFKGPGAHFFSISNISWDDGIFSDTVSDSGGMEVDIAFDHLSFLPMPYSFRFTVLTEHQVYAALVEGASAANIYHYCDNGGAVTDDTTLHAPARNSLGFWDGIRSIEFCYGEVEKSAAPVPEPTSLLLIGMGLVGLAGYGKMRLKKTR